eukprot:TRINITY_DN35516_c0_g1_i1.p1 TRINITY_DN35516_c0_g1~~TRINITY_DN35516_c0_g1_i1.p1  ORF type:complete len:339 (-),score=49.14 TRINITY_DN35516_c0_g1_i1:223-1215(-)
MCLNDETFYKLYERKLKELQRPLELIPLWSVMELRRAFLYKSSYRDLLCQEKKPFTEVVNGTSVLPENIFRNITNQEFRRNISMHKNSAVDQITVNANNTVTIHYKKNGEKIQKAFDKVILTPTSRMVSNIKFSPRLAYNKTYGMDSLHYLNSVKVFLAFTKPFWAEDNKIPAIPFNSTTTQNGGSGITDLLIRNIFYPSNPFHGYSILVSYVWEEDADRLNALSDEDLKQKALANMVEIHGEIARETYKEGKVVKWMEQDWTAGAFVFPYPGQNHKLLDALRAPHMGKVFFAGEYTSKFDHGWIQAAAESACRVSHDMFGRNDDNGTRS